MWEDFQELNRYQERQEPLSKKRVPLDHARLNTATDKKRRLGEGKRTANGSEAKGSGLTGRKRAQ